MNLRIKFLAFLGVFLLGSFLIITWKSFNIFSQKYTMAMGQAELQKLEVQAQTLAQRFHNFKSALKEEKNVEAQLTQLGVPLMAHVISEDGKWKAQWFEGQTGARQAAHGATQQIPFASLSTTRKSWHLINAKELGSSLAYVIPSLSKNSVSFYVFFLNKDFFKQAFQGQSQQEAVALVSPFLGEVYSSGVATSAIDLETYKKTMRDQQSGVLALNDSRSLVYLFNSDLQLYLVKSKKLAELSVDKPVYLFTLGVMIALLIGIALFAQDLLLKKMFAEGHLTEEDATETESVVTAPQPETPTVVETPPAPTVSAEESNWDKLLTQIRPRAINSLGYLHKIKLTNPSSPQLILLETELRELRRLVDPTPGTEASAPHTYTPVVATPSVQPSFNPFLKETFAKETEVTTTAGGVVIRKPKRDENESRKL